MFFGIGPQTITPFKATRPFLYARVRRSRDRDPPCFRRLPRINKVEQCSLLVEAGGKQLSANQIVDGLYKTGHRVAFTPKSQGTTVMIRTSSFRAVIFTTVAFGALSTSAGIANADGFSQTNLVSNIPGLATATDSSLVNPWGVSFANGSPVWISDQGTQTAPLFSVTGSTGVSNQPLFTVNIPPAGASGPTGQVANGMGMGFDVGNGGNGKSANFIFANLNGSISAWDNSPHTQAITQTSVAGASFTGLAINQADTMLFAANDAGSGSIDAFNNSFAQVTGAGFATPAAIAAKGLVPFDVKDIGGNVFVTYAPSGHIAQTKATAGMGAVAEFSESGTFEGMSTAGADSKLASPWGIALAPMSFGKLGGDLLVGNFAFGDSVINAFNPMTWAFEGSIDVNTGGNSPGGLWSLAFGGGGSDGNPNTLFFTDGIDGEKDGLFGSFTAVPEPSTWAMMLAGFGGLAFLAVRRRRASPAIG
jgi:uncharacterized protein (TIGR03118 family)